MLCQQSHEKERKTTRLPSNNRQEVLDLEAHVFSLVDVYEEDEDASRENEAPLTLI